MEASSADIPAKDYLVDVESIKRLDIKTGDRLIIKWSPVKIGEEVWLPTASDLQQTLEILKTALPNAVIVLLGPEVDDVAIVGEDDESN